MKKNYEIKVKLLSPLHINGGTATDGKRIMVTRNGRAYIPATLFKGVMRSNFAMLMNTFGQRSDITDRFFGKEGFQRSRVLLDDLEYEGESVFEMRTNISISRYVRKTVDNALVTSEVQPVKDNRGLPIVFIGEMTVYYPDEEMQKYENAVLEAARMICALGSGKSRGLGFVEVSAVEKSGSV